MENQKEIFACFLCLLMIWSTAGCGSLNKKGEPTQASVQTSAGQTKKQPDAPLVSKEQIVVQFQGQKPKEWGNTVTGVITRVPTEEKIVFLTFDACGGPGGSAYDQKLVDYLQQEQIPATFFINSRWIEAHTQLFLTLAQNPLFSLQNHGTQHRPLSMTGRSVYGIRGTRNAGEVYEEIMGTDAKFRELLGRRPRFFRSGTAYYDETAVEIAGKLGYKIIGFDFLGDAGATYSRKQILSEARLRTRPGSIIIYHMNQPQSATCAGIMEVVPYLRSQGYNFKKIADYL